MKTFNFMYRTSLLIGNKTRTNNFGYVRTWIHSPLKVNKFLSAIAQVETTSLCPRKYSRAYFLASCFPKKAYQYRLDPHLSRSGSETLSASRLIKLI
jgi:hypothetical protein